MAQNALHAMRARTQASPATALRAPESLLTPPASSHKPDLDNNEDEDEEQHQQQQQHVTAVASSSSGSTSHSRSSSSSTRAPLQPVQNPACPGSSGA